VLGSTAIFEDAWLEKEDNAKLFDFLLLWLTHQSSIQVLFYFLCQGSISLPSILSCMYDKEPPMKS